MAERKRATSPVTPSATTAQPFSDAYHLKYRPRSLDDVLGQKEVVKSIEATIRSKARQHTFFLIGPGGTGKTTLARIMAGEFGCTDVIEIDAASNSGIDEMRAVMAQMQYGGFGGSGNRAYIVDECHRLSSNAWDSLLKTTEEPPSHVFFFFCSTNPSKIPAAMLTRGPNYTLQPIRFDDLMDRLEAVCEAEKLDTPEWGLEVCARACGGSMRLALVMLAQVQDAATEDEARALVAGIGETPEVIDLCRLIVKGPFAWQDAIKLVKAIDEQGTLQPEGIRIMVTNYMAKTLMGTKGRQANYLLDVLHAFSKPTNPTDKMAPILLALSSLTNDRN